MHEVFIILLKSIGVLLLVLLNGFFVCAEFAIIKVRATQIQALMARGSRRARLADYLLNNLNGCLSATQLGITMASLGLGWVGVDRQRVKSLTQPAGDGGAGVGEVAGERQ